MSKCFHKEKLYLNLLQYYSRFIFTFFATLTHLEVVGNEFEGRKYFLRCSLRLHCLAFLGKDRLTLSVNLLSLFIGLLLQHIVCLYPLQKIVVTPTAAHVNDAAVYSLSQLAVAYHFGHLDADCVFVYVKDHTSATVVVVVWHTLLLRRIHLDVDVVSALERRQETGHIRHTLRFEGLGEFVPCAGTETIRVRHFLCLRFFTTNTGSRV